VNLQVSIMKVLSSYPGRFARHVDIKRDLELLATSGQDWAKYSKRLGMAFPALNIFSLGLVSKYSFGWRLTNRGLVVLEMMEEAASASAKIKTAASAAASMTGQPSLSVVPLVAKTSLAGQRFRFTVIEGGKSEAA